MNPVNEHYNATTYIRRGGVSHELTWLFILTSLGGWSQGFALPKCLLEKGHGQDDPYSKFQWKIEGSTMDTMDEGSRVLRQSTLSRGIVSSRTIAGSVSLSPGNDSEVHNERAESCRLYTSYQPIILPDRARASSFRSNVSIFSKGKKKGVISPLPTFHRPHPRPMRPPSFP